jgi:cytochrome d ubiquinol oxidase subunit II
MDISLVDLLNPYSLFVGITAVAMLSLHGSIFLAMKVEDDLLARVKAAIPRLMAVFFVLMTVLIGWTLLESSEVTDNYRDRLWIGIFPVLAFVAVIAAWRFLHRGYYLSAFFSSALMIALLLGAVAAGLYPVMLPSSLDQAYDLTITNAASADNTLTVMLVMAIIGIPFVLLYTAGVYYFFRGRVELDEESY